MEAESICLFDILTTDALTVNELVKSNVAALRQKSVDKLTMPERLFAGACAGLCYWVGTFPLDAIKVTSAHMSLRYCMCVFARTHTYVHSCVHTLVHTDMCMYTYIHTYIRTYANSLIL